MKCLEYGLEDWQLSMFFEPIRSKTHIIEILMQAIKLMLINSPQDSLDSGKKIRLQIAKMSRIFFFSEEKYFSIAFPFFVKSEGGNKVSFWTKRENFEVDHVVTSEILSVIGGNELEASSDLYQFVEPLDNTSTISEGLWSAFRDLLLLEEGYVRYDDDKEHECGQRHPRYHCDLFYQSSNQAKFGLSKPVTAAEFVDLLNIETDCGYIHQS